MDDNSVLSIINQVTGQGQPSTAALPAVLSQAAQSGATPDQEAEWQRLARESNVPVGLIRNGAPVKLMQLQQQGASLPATNPVTARTLLDPDNAAVAHDDIGTLTRLEDLARNGFGGQSNAPISTLQFGTPRDQAEANYFAGEYGTKPFQAIQGGTGRLATKLAFPVAAVLDAVNGDDDYKEFASQLYDAFSDIQKQSAASPEQGFGGKLFRSLEELAPMVLSGSAGLGNIVGQAVNEKYDDLTAKGVDPDTATGLALKAGMSAYAMTKLPFGGSSLVNSLVRGATLNPVFGVLDRALDKAGLNYVGYDKQADAINLMAPEEIAHEMALGLVFGAQHAMETGRPIVGSSVLETLLPLYDQYQAGRRADALTEIGKIVQDSKVNGRAPDLVQQHLSDVAEEHAGIDNAYVPVNRWNELFQSAGLDPATVADEVLSNPEAYHEANRTGSDIVIPFGEFTGKLSGLDQYGELVKDAKLSLGDASLRETEAQAQAVKDNAGIGGGFIDALKNMLSRSQEAVKGNESYNKVYDDLVGQQLDIGTDRSTAEHNAQLVANAFRVLGERASVDPYDLYRDYNLKLAGPDQFQSAINDLAGSWVRELNQEGSTWSPEKLMQKYNTDEQSYFGPVWRDLAHNDKGAIERLTQHRTGEAIGALHHPDVGDIDLVWGKEGTAAKEYLDGYGLAKILVKHADVVDNLQEILRGMSVASRGKNRIQLETEDHKAAVRLDWEGIGKRWLLTEFKKDQEPGTGKRTGASSINESDSPIHQALTDNILYQDNQNVKRGLIRLDSNHNFVPAPDGRYVFGEITPEIGAAIRRQSAPILLRNGNEQEGKIHIERPERLKQIQAAGYGSAEELVDSVVTGCDAIYQGQKGNLLLARKNDKNSVVYIQLTPSERGDFYDVKTAAVVRRDFFDKKKPLWERAQTNPPDNGSPMRDLSGQSSTIDSILRQFKENVKPGFIRFDNTNINSKPSDVDTLLQSVVNHIATDGVKELYQSEKAPVSEDSRDDLPNHLPDDRDELWAKLKAPLLPGSEARGAEPSRGDGPSTLIQSIPNTGDHVDIKIIDNDQKEATASATSTNSDDHVKKVVAGVLHSAITRIKTPADAAHIAFPLTKRAQEAAIAIVTDANGDVLGAIQHSTGALDSTTLSPRDLLGVVHDFPGAAEVWFAHNHPSGDPTPSLADRQITSVLSALLDGSGIKSRGMIVVGQEGGAVLTKGKGDRGESIPLGLLNTDKERTHKIITYDREIIKLPSSESITSVQHVIDYARLFGDGDSGIIILNSKGKPVSFVPMSVAKMAKLKTGDSATGSSLIMSAFHKGNGASMIMIVPALPGSQAAARNLAAFGAKFDAPLNDVIYSGNGLSFKNTGRMPEILNYFYQGGDDKRGYIRFDNTRNFEIGLLKHANLSTFIHESGHFFTEVLDDLAERSDAPRQIKDDYAALLKFAGVESRADIRTEHHETLARAFEAYIREGNAPSVEMHSVFQRMKAWMISVYKDMTALNVQLNPEIRDVFDRMLATDSEIERMRDTEDMKPLFATAEDAGMSQAEFDLYRKDAEQAGELAKEQLLRKLMAEKDREQTSWWKEERKRTWAEVEDEAKNDPIYQTYQALTTGKTFDGRATGDVKLSREALVKQYGEAFVKKLPREFQRVYSKEGGLHPDAVAEMAGFGSGDEMVRKMAAAPKLKDYVKAETDRRMRDRYGDMMTDGSIHEQALKDVHNDAQGKVMQAELQAIRRKAGEVRPFVRVAGTRGADGAEATTAQVRAKEARDREESDAMLGDIPPIRFFKITATEAIGAKRVAEILPHLYSNAAGKSALESSEAAERGDYEKAGAAKYRELLNHYLYKEAVKARDFADKVQAYANRMGTMKELGKSGQAGGQFLDQIRAILDRYGFTRISNKEADERMQYREPLDAFLRRMNDEEGVVLPIPDAVRQEIQRTNYRNLSMDELAGVYDSVRMLEHATRQVNQVNAEGRKVELTQAALSLSNRLFSSVKDAADLARESDGVASLLDRVKDVNLDIPVPLPELMFERFDGMKNAGPWHEFIWDRYNDAADRQIRLREMLFPKIMEYAHGSAIDRSMGKIHIDSLNADLVKDDIIAIALNCGNTGNLDKLLRGGLCCKGNEPPIPLNHEALQEILSHLSAQEIDVVNGIWSAIDLLKPEAAGLARKRTGIEPDWIEAQPMQVRNGTLEGGYYPVKYDAHYSAGGEKQSDPSSLDQMFNKYAAGSTRQGYMDERASFASPLSLDWQSIVSRNLDEVITEISHWQFFTDAQRLLKRPEVRDAVQDRLGSEYYQNLLDWLRYTVSQDNVSPEVSGNIEKFRRQIRSNMSACALSFKVADAVNEMVAGIPLKMQQLKTASAFKGIMQYLRNPVEATRFATLASDYMRNIDANFDRDIAQALHFLTGHHSVADDIRHWSFATRTFLQKIGAVMAWHAGYIDAQEQGMQGNPAVRNADSICRMTQGSGRGGDASTVQRDTYVKELARFIGPRMKDHLDRAGVNPDSMNNEELIKAVSAAAGGNDLYQDAFSMADAFRADLKAYFDKTLPPKNMLVVGVPSNVLREADITGSRIVLKQSVLNRKGGRDADHEYAYGSLSRLPEAINNPILVVDQGDNKKAVITEMLMNGRNLPVALETKKAGKDLEVSRITTLFGKKAEGIAAWLESGHKAWFNEQKAQKWLAVLQPTVSDRIAKNLKPSQYVRPFSNEAVKQSDEQIVESPVSFNASDSNFQIGLATLLAGYVANTMISRMMSGKLPDKPDKLTSWMLARLTLGLFDGFPLLRDVAAYAEGGTTSGKDKEMRLLPVLQWGKDAVDGFTKTVEAITDYGEWNKAVIRDAKAGRGATGLPALAGSTVGRYIYDVLSGDYAPDIRGRRCPAFSSTGRNFKGVNGER